MQINATIFIQAANFFIAYLMFRSILFRPASIVLEQEKKELDYLDGLIEQDKHQVAVRTAEREAQWNSVRDYFFKNSSGLSRERDFVRGISPIIAPQTLSMMRSKRLAEKLQLL